LLNKIIYTILGFGLAIVFFPHTAKDQVRPPQVSGVAVSRAKAPQAITAPELVLNLTPPALTAKAALAYDLESGSILYSKNMDQALSIASLTKLMTALVVVEQTDLQNTVVVDLPDSKIVGINLGLTAGEELKVADLLSAMLIPSSNNAALILSKYVAGDEAKFVELMNEQARKLGLRGTRFSNPVGWDTDDNHSTVQDLILVVKEFVKHPELTQLVRTARMEIVSLDGKYTHQLLTTNQLLLNNPEVVGIKTGWTSKALGNLIIMANHNQRRVVTIILGSENREQDSQKLLDWIETVYIW